MAAAGDEAEERRLERIGLEEVGGDVTLQVVDRDQRQPARCGDRLRGADADQQGADQARAGRDRNRLDVVQRRSSLAQGGLDDRRRQLEVVARGDLGHDAAERAWAAACEEIALASTRGPSSTAAQVSSQEVSIASAQSSHMISASSPLSW